MPASCCHSISWARDTPAQCWRALNDDFYLMLHQPIFFTRQRCKKDARVLPRTDTDAKSGLDHQATLWLGGAGHWHLCRATNAQDELRAVTRRLLYSSFTEQKFHALSAPLWGACCESTSAARIQSRAQKHGSTPGLPRRAAPRDQLGRRAHSHTHRCGTAKANALEDTAAATRAAALAQVATTERPRGRAGGDAQSSWRRARRGRRRGRGALRTAAVPRAGDRRDLPRLPGAGAAPTKGAGARDARQRGDAGLLPLRAGAPRRFERRRNARMRAAPARVARRRATTALADVDARPERPEARGAVRLVGAREARRARVRALPRLPLENARRRDGVGGAAAVAFARSASWGYHNRRVRCGAVAGGGVPLPRRRHGGGVWGNVCLMCLLQSLQTQHVARARLAQHPRCRRRAWADSRATSSLPLEAYRNKSPAAPRRPR